MITIDPPLPLAEGPTEREARLTRELAQERARNVELRTVLIQAKKTLRVLGLKNQSAFAQRMRDAINAPRTVIATNGGRR